MGAAEFESAGNPSHPDHDEWLLELGRVTRAAAQVAMVCFDVARIVGGVGADEMYDNPLGELQRRLHEIDATNLPGLPEFLFALESARHTRNDVMHAFLVRDGLLRRSVIREYDRAFYDVASLVRAREQIGLASRLGNEFLHSNGGAEVEGWRQEN